MHRLEYYIATKMKNRAFHRNVDKLLEDNYEGEE